MDKKKKTFFLSIVITLLWSTFFIVSKINSQTAVFINDNNICRFLKYSYYNFYSLLVVTSFCFINILLIIKNFVKKESYSSNKWFNALYITISIIAYTVHFLVFRYFLQGAFAG